ncbi:YHS domain-containing (seleno)protein (plasmid) [Thalassobaculum sp. OXR-137]|nr:YHS domain-containing (seleno)protein [Thalassobaculum sp. OXR-137]WPZ37280.1 YHS domain-containing (seleno)protein [Thalassobaculum sp. OXR-137]
MLVAGGLASVLASSAAWAGPQYVDDSGYAVSGYDVVAYFDMNTSPIGEPPAAVPGSTEFTAEHNGAVFAFSSAANRERFLNEPARYAPQFDGHCAFGVAKGGKVPGDPNLWRIVDGKLYLNLQKSVAEMWLADIPGNVATAETNWPNIEAAPASDRQVPELPANDPAPERR